MAAMNEYISVCKYSVKSIKHRIVSHLSVLKLLYILLPTLATLTCDNKLVLD